MDLFDYGADGIWGFRDAEFTGYAARLVGALEHVNPVHASKTSKGYSLDVVIDGNPIKIMILNSTMPNGDQVWYVNKQLLSNSFVTDEEGDFCTVIISSENSDRIVEDILAHLCPDRPMDIVDRLDEARHVLHRRLIGFSFANFKAFGNRQHIPIRPITLVFGPNSGGKSSIIQGMIFAHEAVRTGNANIFATKLGGRAIDLGGFRQYIHKRQIERTCELTISLKSDSIKHDLSYSSFSDAFDTISLTVSIGMPLDFNGNTLPNGAPNVTSLTVEGDGRFLFRMKGFQANGEFLIDKIDLEQDPFYTEIVYTYHLDKDQTIEMIIQPLAEMISHNKVLVRDFLPVGIEKKLYFPNDAKTNSEKTLNTKMGGAGDQSDLFNDKMKERYSDLIGVLDSLIYWINSDVREQVARLQYLGPLRSYPSRNLVSNEHYDTNWFAGGGYAWDVVKRNPDVRRKVNEWLGGKGKLATPYELMSYEYELCEKGKSGLNGIEEIRGLGAETYANPSIQELFMVDRRTNTAVTHRDVGIGISQVLPVLVCAYASHKQILAMEQPEIHLHPALQAELADVFIESAIGKDQNTFILETHSEHLLLRMMRRMRETANGTQQNPDLRLTPEDIIVLYVEPVGSQSIIREMPLNEYGELMKAWPGGFFEEGLREVF